MKWIQNTLGFTLTIGLVTACANDVSPNELDADSTPTPTPPPTSVASVSSEVVAEQLILAQQLSFMSPFSVQGYLSQLLYYPAPSSASVEFFGPQCESSGSIDYLYADLDGDKIFVSPDDYSQMNFVECNNQSSTTSYTNHTNGNIIRTVISSKDATIVEGNERKLSDAGFFSEQVAWQRYSHLKVEGTESYHALDGEITTEGEWRRNEENWRRLQVELQSGDRFVYSTDSSEQVTFTATRITADTIQDDTQFTPIHRSIDIAGTHSTLGALTVQMSNWQTSLAGDPELEGSAEVRFNETVVRVSNMPASTESGLPSLPYLHMLFDENNDGQVDRSVLTNQVGQEFPAGLLNP